VNEDKKKARAAAKLAALLGMDVPTGQQATAKERPGAASREAEATLLYIDNKGAGFVEKVCERCPETFAASSPWVRFCSDPCRKADAWDKGIEWDPGKPYTSRWRNMYKDRPRLEHAVVGPQALQVAKQALDQQVEEHEITEVEVVVSDCTEACEELHTYESGCAFYFTIDDSNNLDSVDGVSV
jgi:hypothetical protein